LVKIRTIVSDFNSTFSKIHPVTFVLDKVSEYAIDLKKISKKDINKFSNPYNRAWKVSKLFKIYYIVHPKKENVLIEAKDYVRCVFEEQVDAIINYCSKNANIKYISIERVRNFNINAEGRGQYEGSDIEAKYHYSERTTFFVEHDLESNLEYTPNDNSLWMDEFPDVKNFINKFTSGKSRMIADYDYKQGFSIVIAKLFQLNINDMSEGNKLIISVRS
jgi:hypothetical protein